MTTLRRGLNAEEASWASRDIASRLEVELGPPARAEGRFDAAYLSAGALSTSTLSYRYRDYLVDVTAANLSDSGIAVREHYISAVD